MQGGERIGRARTRRGRLLLDDGPHRRERRIRFRPVDRRREAAVVRVDGREQPLDGRVIAGVGGKHLTEEARAMGLAQVVFQARLGVPPMRADGLRRLEPVLALEGLDRGDFVACVGQQCALGDRVAGGLRGRLRGDRRGHREHDQSNEDGHESGVGGAADPMGAFQAILLRARLTGNGGRCPSQSVASQLSDTAVTPRRSLARTRAGTASLPGHVRGEPAVNAGRGMTR